MQQYDYFEISVPLHEHDYIVNKIKTQLNVYAICVP